MEDIKVRPQELDDAQRFYEILNNDKFIFFDVRPPSAKAERDFLKLNAQKVKNNSEYNFTILFNGDIAGAVGVKIDAHRNFIGEIGYFIDEKYWGNGLAAKAVHWAESYCFNKLNLQRIVIVMAIENKASEKVAIKAGYKKEGVMKKGIGIFGKYHDAYLYAKTID